MRLLATALLALLPLPALAVPSAVTFQGRLVDALGVPVEDPVTIDVSLYSDAGTGVLLWSGSTTVDPEGGYFATTLGAPPMSPIDSAVFSTEQAWVQIDFPGSSDSPRIPLNSTPFALVASEVAMEVLEQDDPRLVWSSPIIPSDQVCTTGSWCDYDERWGENRLAVRGTYSFDDTWDTSHQYVDLVLDNNEHRTVILSHLDWENSGAFDVLLSFDGGTTWSFHKRVETRRQTMDTPFTSQLRTLATNLPLGEDVRVRVRGAWGRMHVEGFALSRSLHPETADRTACPVGTVRVTSFCIQRETTAAFGQTWTAANAHCGSENLRLCGHHEIIAGIRSGAVPLYDYNDRDAWFVTAILSENTPGTGGYNQTCDIQGNPNQSGHPIYSTQCSHDMEITPSWRTTICCY